jgi:hypothetical protein
LPAAKARCEGLKVLQDKTHVLTFDTKWKYQDAELEFRYKEFKEFRDQDLQPKVPKGLKKILDQSNL